MNVSQRDLIVRHEQCQDLFREAEQERLAGTVTGRSGARTGIPASRAASFTGEGASFRPLPLGLSGWVTTPTISCPPSLSPWKEGREKAGVPQKRTFRRPPPPGSYATS